MNKINLKLESLNYESNQNKFINENINLKSINDNISKKYDTLKS